jgi:hypothetical protein
MVDWVTVLTPLSLLPIIWLCGFVGCSIEEKGTAPATKATGQKLVTLTWGTVKSDTTSILFECDVYEVSATGVKSPMPFHGVAVGAAAWPPNYVPPGGKTSAWVTVDLPLATTYSINASSTVTVASSGVKIPLTKPGKSFPASADWEFFLLYDPAKGWDLL